MADETSTGAINVGTITLSMYKTSMEDPWTTSSEKLTANVYTVDGVTWADGSLRQLSIGELVMAICLQRASELEDKIIEMMKEMEETSARLEELSNIESRVLEALQGDSTATYTFTEEERTLLKSSDILKDGQTYVSHSPADDSGISYDDFITQIEAKMDEQNSFSQQSMIELQSYTNKRDQSYDMVSNILKSLHTTNLGTVNNI